MKTQLTVALALLTGCNYDYSILAGADGQDPQLLDASPPPAEPEAETYDEPESVTDDATETEADNDTGSEEPVVEDDSDAGPLEDTDAPDGDPPVDVRVEDTDPAVDTEPPPPPCDLDGDGWDNEGCGGSDCDDDDAGVHPLGGDSWGDGVDSDCDGLDCNAALAGGTYIAACIADASTSHESADAMCTLGGHDGLASLTSSEEWSLGLSLRPLSVGHKFGSYRIGLTAAGPSEPFQWDAGGSPPADFWSPGNPSRIHLGLDELCAVIYPSDMPGYLGPNKLNDDWCWEYGDVHYGFICETRE